jgi:hypothetical protein
MVSSLLVFTTITRFPFLLLVALAVVTVAVSHTHAVQVIDVVTEQNSNNHNHIRGWYNDRSVQTVGQIDNLILYDAVTDQPIVTLTNGMVVNTATLNVDHTTGSFNVVATIRNGVVGSVKFGYNGKNNLRIEAEAPYALCGNKGTNYYVCTFLGTGQHNLTVTSYSGSKANGTIGSIRTLSFRIVHSVPVVPTKAPTKAPVVMPTGMPVSFSKCSIPKVNIDRWSVILHQSYILTQSIGHFPTNLSFSRLRSSTQGPYQLAKTYSRLSFEFPRSTSRISGTRSREFWRLPLQL